VSVKIWLLKQRVDEVGWDDYRGFVVQAKTEERARELASKGRPWNDGSNWTTPPETPANWLDPEKVSAEWLGHAKGIDPVEGVVLADCNQG
jgi:hypothetical protein